MQDRKPIVSEGRDMVEFWEDERVKVLWVVGTRNDCTGENEAFLELLVGRQVIQQPHVHSSVGDLVVIQLGAVDQKCKNNIVRAYDALLDHLENM